MKALLLINAWALFIWPAIVYHRTKRPDKALGALLDLMLASVVLWAFLMLCGVTWASIVAASMRDLAAALP